MKSGYGHDGGSDYEIELPQEDGGHHRHEIKLEDKYTKVEEIQKELQENEIRLGQLEKEMSFTAAEYWQFAKGKATQYLMERNYQEILKKILMSKMPSVMKLVNKHEFAKLIQQKILTEAEVKRSFNPTPPPRH